MDWKGKSRSSEQERVQDEAEFSGLLATLCAISWILASLTLFDNSCVGPLAARCAQDIPRPPTPSSANQGTEGPAGEQHRPPRPRARSSPKSQSSREKDVGIWLSKRFTLTIK